VRPEISKFQGIELRLVRFRVNGREIAIPSFLTITLTFQKGQQISGQSAINRYGGVFTPLPNGKIAVQLTTTTQMAGPPELMELESKYFDGLSHVKQVLLTSNRIILENETTSMEFAFSRAQ
jgi:heat shock protein HslJ